MIPAIIACKVDRDANGHEWRSSFRIAISAMPLKRTWITSRSMSASGQEQAIRSVRVQAVKRTLNVRRINETAVLWPLPYKLKDPM